LCIPIGDLFDVEETEEEKPSENTHQEV
jgi:hypothetical protein